MKKITFLLVAIMATMLCACSNNDETTSDTLAGTTWGASEELDGKIYIEWKLVFQESTFKLEFKGDEDGDGKFDQFDSISGSYKLDGNKISLSADELMIQGTIKENSMYFPKTANSDELTFHKK